MIYKFIHRPMWSEQLIESQIELPNDGYFVEVTMENYCYEGSHEYLYITSEKVSDFGKIDGVTKCHLKGMTVVHFESVNFEETIKQISIDEINRMYHWDDKWFEKMVLNENPEIIRVCGFSGHGIHMNIVSFSPDLCYKDEISLYEITEKYVDIDSIVAKHEMDYCLKELTKF